MIAAEFFIDRFDGTSQNLNTGGTAKNVSKILVIPNHALIFRTQIRGLVVNLSEKISISACVKTAINGTEKTKSVFRIKHLNLLFRDSGEFNTHCSGENLKCALCGFLRCFRRRNHPF